MTIQRLITSFFVSILLATGVLSAQFIDALSPIPMEDFPITAKTLDGIILSGTSLEYGLQTNLEGVAIRFTAGGTPEVQFRFLSEGGNWSESVTAKIFPEPFSDRFIATFRGLQVEQSTLFKYELNIEGEYGSILAGGLMLKEVETIPEVKDLPQIFKLLDVVKPRIISREEWGANPPKYGYDNHPYFDKLTLHHAAGWAAGNLEDGKKQVKAIQAFHQEGRGWNDIAYHFVVDMAGNIYQGRPETVLGAHVGGANTGNIGVCLLGCYHPPEQSLLCTDQMSAATERSLIQLYAWISETYGVNSNVLLGHRDYFPGRTSCPGDNVWPLIPPMRADIALYIEFGEQPTRFVLYQNYPNPFNSVTTLHYDLPENLPVKLIIYDINGRKVRGLVNEEQRSGYKKVIWDGKDDAGKAVSTGVYIQTINMGVYADTKKLLLLK